MPDLSEEYTARLNRVLDAIHAGLDGPLSLDALSAVAGFSPYHFHRIFKAYAGETLGEYIQRARLEKAANLLVFYPRRPVLEIALESGFSGAAVFTRAFRARFGASPTQYRAQARNSKNRKADRKQGKEMLSTSGYNHFKQPAALANERRTARVNVEIKQLPTYHVAYIRHISGYSKGEFNPELNQAFHRVCGWAAARDLSGPATLVIGIPYDNPDITPNDRCRYDACVTVPETIREGSGEVGIEDIPGGKYAVTRISVSSAETRKIGETVDALYGEWLPSSGYQPAGSPALEIYYDNPDHAPGEWITMEYCVPVEPL